MAEELRIVISADVEQARAGLNSVSEASERTATNIGKIGAAANSTATGLNSISTSATKIASTVGSANTALANTGKTAAATVPAVDQLQTGVSELGDTLETLRAKSLAAQQFIFVDKDVNNIARLNQQIEALEKEILRVKNIGKTGFDLAGNRIQPIPPAVPASVDRLNQSLAKIPSTTNQGTLALINFGRVIQDAPFGILGMANNINPLVESLQRLSATAKATGTSIGTQLLGALKGGGGLGLAISAITSALTFAAIGFTFFNRGAAGSKKVLDETKKAADDLKESIAGIFGQSAKEAAEVGSLIALLNSEAESRERKLAAIKKLNEIAPENFKNIKLEGEAVIGLNTAYDAYLAQIQTVLAVKIKQAQVEQLIEQLLRKQGVTLVGTEKALAEGTKRLQESLTKIGNTTGVFNPLIESIQTARADEEKETNKIKEDIKGLFKDIQELSKGIKLKIDVDDNKDAEKRLTEVERKIIDLAKQSEKVFAVPLKLKFDSTDLDTTKLSKAVEILRGIRDFSIKARVDIELPDIKELPKEEVDKFFKNVPDAFTDALNKGLLDVPKEKQIFIGAEIGPFSKEIQDTINQFNKEGFKIPITFELKDADLLATLKTSFADFQKAVDAVKKVSFDDAINQLEKLGAVGKEAGRQTEVALLQAGATAEEALAAGQAVADSIGGISEQAADAANAINALLTPAFQNLFSAIIAGKDPLQSFFKSIIQSIDQLISKLIAAAIQAAIFSAFSSGGSVGFDVLFRKFLGFAEGGRPPVGKPSIVGEKGWEIFVPDTAGTIISHDKAVQMASVKENNQVREYFANRQIAESIKAIETRLTNVVYRISEQSDRTNKALVERFTTHSDAVNKFVQSSITATNDRSIEAIRYITRDKSDSSKEVLSSYKLLVSDSIKNVFDSKDITFDKAYFDKVNNTLSKVINNDKSKEISDSYVKLINDTVNSVYKEFYGLDKQTIEKGGEISHDELRKIISNNRFEKSISSAFGEFVEKATSKTDKITERLSNYKEFYSTTTSQLKEFKSSSDTIRDSNLFATILKTTKESYSENINSLVERITNNSEKQTIISRLESFTSTLKSFTDKFKLNNTLREYSKLESLVEKIANSSESSKLQSSISTLNSFTDKLKVSVTNNIFGSSSEKLSVEKLHTMFKIPKFEFGGLAFGPTLGILGEGFGISRSNPEVVAPLNQLKGILGGAFDLNVTLNGQTRIAGNDLLYFVNQAMKTQLRTTGRTGL